MVAKLVRKAYARTHSEIRIPDAHGGKAGLRWGFKLDAKVLKVGDDRLGGVIVGNVVRDRVWEHHGIIFEVEAFHQAVLQPGSRMGLVAETDVGREIAGYVPVVRSDEIGFGSTTASFLRSKLSIRPYFNQGAGWAS